MRVAIVGAGIGGLAAALACHDAGLDVQLFEQAIALDEVGAGLQLGANATRVLARLGVLEALLAVAVRPQEVRLRAAVSGRRVAVRPLGAVNDARYGAPYLHLHRADLQRVLTEAVRARGIPLTLDRRLLDVRQQDNTVQLTFTTVDGASRTVDTDACIGADGLHSRVREALFGAAAPQFTGNVAWRATVPVTAHALPAAAREPVVTVWMGDGGHLVQYLVRGGALVNIVAVFEDTRWSREGWHETGDADALRARFAGWHPEVRALLAQVTDCHLWALCDRTPMPSWRVGRCTLLGDACHPMLPFLAQGAAMAIEDGWVLAQCLADNPGNTTAALDAYEKARQPRTARVQAEARQQATLFHLAGPAALARDLVLGFGSRVLPGVAMARYDWLYGQDVTAAASAVSPRGPRR